MTDPAKEQIIDDEYWMRRALELADKAATYDEVPVGAVLVKDGQLIGSGWNQPISSCDPSAHAEIMALRNAASNVQNYRLPGTTLYVTIEPCAMCTGALLHARVGKLVFGAPEPRNGAVTSQLAILDHQALTHNMEWQSGVLEEACRERIQAFFKARRAGLKPDRKPENKT
ncbi:MAG: tRNA adenosine(34) deaminase TadA [Pseudomonadales bacterium]|nr:tRNA adenosine(34) deaminase TadA [Pseudomonadales bacterium]